MKKTQNSKKYWFITSIESEFIPSICGLLVEIIAADLGLYKKSHGGQKKGQCSIKNSAVQTLYIIIVSNTK